jgi:uncharacterized glyoxalase superfamily protein PhnB
MQPTPPGWPRISSAIYYQNAAQAIDWLCRAFGFEVRLRIEGDGGRIEHSELTIGSPEVGLGLVMVGEATGKDAFPQRRSPQRIEGHNTQNLMVYVDDVEAHCRQARAAGAVVLAEPATHDYGEDYWTDRGYECVDPEGHRWWFYQRLRSAGPRA